jgi:tRNA threonylcarbamoyladenosine biosynthesis protein TsaB
LSAGGETLFERVSPRVLSHAALLGVYIEEALELMRQKGLHPEAIAVSSGPGSYTGLRIGVSLAKGLCFGYAIPLIGVPTLEILASRAIAQISAEDDSLYCAMLDARRMEVYAALFNRERQVVRGTMAEEVTPASYASFLTRGKVYFLGNGAEKCKAVLSSPHAVFVDDLHPLAVDMIPIAEELFRAGRFEDTAYFEPFYLKEFRATVARNKVLASL